MHVLLHASCLVDHDRAESVREVAVLPMYNTHVPATGRSVLLHEKKPVS